MRRLLAVYLLMSVSFASDVSEDLQQLLNTETGDQLWRSLTAYVSATRAMPQIEVQRLMQNRSASTGVRVLASIIDLERRRPGISASVAYRSCMVRYEIATGDWMLWPNADRAVSDTWKNKGRETQWQIWNGRYLQYGEDRGWNNIKKVDADYGRYPGLDDYDSTLASIAVLLTTDRPYDAQWLFDYPVSATWAQLIHPATSSHSKAMAAMKESYKWDDASEFALLNRPWSLIADSATSSYVHKGKVYRDVHEIILQFSVLRSSHHREYIDWLIAHRLWRKSLYTRRLDPRPGADDTETWLIAMKNRSATAALPWAEAILKECHMAERLGLRNDLKYYNSFGIKGLTNWYSHAAQACGDEGAAMMLRLSKNDNPWVRGMAVYGLINLGHRRQDVRDRIREISLRDSDAAVRKNSAELFERMENAQWPAPNP